MPDTLELSPDGEAVTHAVRWLERIAQREGLPRKLVFGLTLSVDEAVTNVVDYAFVPPPADGITPAIILSYRRDGARIEVELRDNGQPHDPTRNQPPALVTKLDDAKIGGHGIRLMRHYLHDLAYRRDDGWNCLTLTVHAEAAS